MVGMFEDPTQPKEWLHEGPPVSGVGTPRANSMARTFAAKLLAAAAISAIGVFMPPPLSSVTGQEASVMRVAGHRTHEHRHRPGYTR
jgi:hypothetical protein